MKFMTYSAIFLNFHLKKIVEYVMEFVNPQKKSHSPYPAYER